MTRSRPRLPGPDLRSARSQAYALSVAPFLFQAARAAQELGVLSALHQAGIPGLSAQALASQCALPETAVDTLLDALLAGELVDEDAAGQWRLTTVGLAWTSDPGVAIEANFTHTVCWQGLADLSASLASATPVGLRHLGPWSTIYEGLSQLDDAVRKAWFAYDHGHSDSAFRQALAILAEHQPQQLLDVGANTGRFAKLALQTLPQLSISLLDLPGQLREAEAHLRAAGLDGRAAFHGANLLDHSQPFPGAGCHDAVWMSQFLDCFAPTDIVSLLQRARAAVAEQGSVWVLECCPDRQQEPAAATCLRLESLYFTAIANGVSRFYRAPVLIDCAEQAGLQVQEVWDGLGSAHTLFRLTKKSSE